MDSIIQKRLEKLETKIANAQNEGNYEQAIEFAKDFLDIARAVLDPDSQDFLLILKNVADIYKAAGKYNETEALYNEILDINRKLNDEVDQEEVLGLHYDLYDAITNGNLEYTKWVISFGINLNKKNPMGQPHLVYAASQNSLEIVKELLANRANVNATDDKGQTPLMLAVTFSGNIDIVRALIAAGADVNVKTAGGVTLLISAAANGKVDIVKELIAAGADVNAQDNNGITALIAALNAPGLLALVIGLDNEKSKNSPEVNELYKAALNNSTAIFYLLIDNGANINIATNNGETPLMSAVASINIEAVKELIKRGCNIKATNSEGYSALSAAKASNNRELIKLLKN